jgi:diguanylate cyclase (GGDEF)-like protein
MRASSVTRRLQAATVIRDWAWWQLPGLLRAYIGVVSAAAFLLIGVAASQTSWHTGDLVKFLLLLGCGMISVAATPRIAYRQGAMVRDFLTVWVLPVAILLPPFYAMLTPVPLLILTQLRTHWGVIYRRVFTAAAIGLAYGAASLMFRAYPASFGGGALGTGLHALAWTAAVASCEIVGAVGHNILLAVAIKLSDPTVRIVNLELNREALQGDFAEIDLGILITVVVAVQPVLAVFAVPTVLLARRFMMHAQLVAKSRIDAKTGLLNAATWETEAAAEISRATRTRSPLSVALIDIDHFKAVNDTHGHLVGDKVLRALGDTFRELLREYDQAGRFGGEEFVILLPQAGEADAMSIAERLRLRVAAMSVPIDDNARPELCVSVTVSIGVAALDASGGQVTDLLAAADAALYVAKRTGRNKTHIATADMSLAQIVPVARQAPSTADIPDSSLRLHGYVLGGQIANRLRSHPAFPPAFSPGVPPGVLTRRSPRRSHPAR